MTTPKELRISIEKTRTGRPAAWEAGGRFTSRGSAVIWANEDGGKKKPLFVRTHGHLACGKHALVPLKEGDIYIAATYGSELEVLVGRISKFETSNETVTAVIEVLFIREYHEWTTPDGQAAEIPALVLSAAQAARDKARVYHCRYPMWVAT